MMSCFSARNSESSMNDPIGATISESGTADAAKKISHRMIRLMSDSTASARGTPGLDHHGIPRIVSQQKSLTDVRSRCLSIPREAHVELHVGGVDRMQENARRSTSEKHFVDLGRYPCRARSQRFRPYSEDDLLSDGKLVERNRQASDRGFDGSVRTDRAFDQVVVAEKAGDETGARVEVEVLRGANLLDAALAHHHDP